MFSKKYVFETRATRSRRLIRNIGLTTFVGIGLVGLLCLYIPSYAQRETEKSMEAFYLKAPDVIAVFTGDAGRIDYALKMTEQYPNAKLFISGVHGKNSLKTILEKQGKGISVEDYLEQEAHHIELDYMARNTMENGISTLNYMRKNPNLRKVLIISSDYHIFRISLIMARLNDMPDASFNFESIRSNYSEVSSIRKLLKEIFKLFKTVTFLIFWDKEHLSQES